MNEVRDRLLRRRCAQVTRDAVWAHLVLRSRTEGATWTVGCVGVALPALTRIAATLSARFAGDPSDIHAAVLTGFLTELARIDLRKPRVMLRLRWAAYRAGHASVREALDAPVPSGSEFRSAEPTPVWGHPDFVLARAVAEKVITAEEAELIGSTRLEGHPLATAAAQRGVSYKAAEQVRRRAEHRLAAYLSDNARRETTAGGGDQDLEAHALDSVTITAAARRPSTHHQASPSGAKQSRPSPKKSGWACRKKAPRPEFRGAPGHQPRPRAPPRPLDRPCRPRRLRRCPDAPDSPPRPPDNPLPVLPPPAPPRTSGRRSSATRRVRLGKSCSSEPAPLDTAPRWLSPAAAGAQARADDGMDHRRGHACPAADGIDRARGDHQVLALAGQ